MHFRQNIESVGGKTKNIRRILTENEATANFTKRWMQNNCTSREKEKERECQNMQTLPTILFKFPAENNRWCLYFVTVIKRNRNLIRKSLRLRKSKNFKEYSIWTIFVKNFADSFIFPNQATANCSLPFTINVTFWETSHDINTFAHTRVNNS